MARRLAVTSRLTGQGAILMPWTLSAFADESGDSAEEQITGKGEVGGGGN